MPPPSILNTKIVIDTIKDHNFFLFDNESKKLLGLMKEIWKNLTAEINKIVKRPLNFLTVYFYVKRNTNDCLSELTNIPKKFEKNNVKRKNESFSKYDLLQTEVEESNTDSVISDIDPDLCIETPKDKIEKVLFFKT